MIHIDNSRKTIDEIDDKLVELLEKRMEIVSKVAEFKKSNNIGIKDRSREEKIVNRLKSQTENEYLKESIEEIMDSIFRASRKKQRVITSENSNKQVVSTENIIGFQGVSGSYSEEALINYFGEASSRVNFTSFEDVFKALDLGEIQNAVLPIENSSTGAIKEVYDLLVKYGFYIIGEQHLRIRHHLLGVNGAKIEDIKEIYSHSQGIEQCSHYLDEHKEWNRVPYYNTAMSAQYVAKTGKNEITAIGSKRAAEIYGLKVLKDNINNNLSNTTRFVILSRQLEKDEALDKISLVFSTPNESGALYDALSRFSEENVNMIKIESRPIKDKPWEYFFFIDIEGNMNEEHVSKALKKIKLGNRYFKILGCYKKENGVE